jgi:hypothetical protein
MRCNCVRCDYNEDNFCKSPDYVGINEKGECTQILILGKTLAEKFNTLRKNMDEAYNTFDSDPTQSNSDRYGMALREFQDFCVSAVEELIKQRPDVASGCVVED